MRPDVSGQQPVLPAVPVAAQAGPSCRHQREVLSEPVTQTVMYETISKCVAPTNMNTILLLLAD